MTRPWIINRRQLLVALLVPLLVATLAVTCWEQQPMWFVRVSPDGNSLALCRGVTDDQGEFVRGVLEVWDLQTGRRRLAKNGAAVVGSLAFSPDSRTLAVGGVHGHIRLWDVKSGEAGGAFQAGGQYIPKLYFSRDGRQLLAVPLGGPARLLNAKTGALIDSIKLPSGFVPATFCQTQDLLALFPTDHSSSPGRSSQVKLYRLTESGFSAVGAIDSPRGRLYLLDGGDKLAVYGSTPNQVRLFDVTTGERLKTIALRAFATDLAFSPNRNELVAVGYAGMLESWDIESGMQTAARMVSSQALWSVAYTPDGSNVVVGGDEGEAIVFDAATGQRKLVFSSYRFFLPAAILLCIAFGVWMLVWIRQGIGLPRRRYRPLRDVLLIHVVVLSIALTRLLYIDRAIDRPPAIVVFAALASLLALLVLWVVFGNARWSLRWTALTVGLALAWACVMLIWRMNDQLCLQIVVAGVVLYSVQIVVLKGLCCWGMRIENERVESPAVSRRRQVTLREALLGTAAVACLFAVARFAATPGPWPMLHVWFLVVVGGSFVLTVLASIWVGLGTAGLPQRLVVVVLVTLVAGAMPRVLFGVTSAPVWLWYPAIHSCTAALIVPSLFVFRAHGFRLSFPAEALESVCTAPLKAANRLE